MEDLIGTSFDNLPRQQASKAIWSVELRAISCNGAASICLALRKEEGGLRFSLGLWVQGFRFRVLGFGFRGHPLCENPQGWLWGPHWGL